jgi:hypothetical protein
MHRFLGLTHLSPGSDTETQSFPLNSGKMSLVPYKALLVLLFVSYASCLCWTQKCRFPKTDTIMALTSAFMIQVGPESRPQRQTKTKHDWGPVRGGPPSGLV